MQNDLPIKIRLKLHYNSMNRAEQIAADYIIQHEAAMLSQMSITEMASCIKVSEATLMRVCKRIGLTGYTQLKLHLAQEQGSVNASTTNVLPNTLSVPIEPGDTTDVIPEKVIKNAINGLIATQTTLNQDMLKNAIDVIRSARQILLFGVSNSAVVCSDIECKLIRLGYICHTYSDPHQQLTVASHLKNNDVVLAVSHSGQTVETIEAVRLAKSRGVTVIVVSNYLSTPLSTLADIQLLTGGHETSFESETMVSRISQLAIIDMLYIGLILSDYDHNLHLLEQTNRVLENKKQTE